MRIAWCTPFGVKSAIGKVSQAATGELANFCEVEIWCPDHTPLLLSNVKINPIMSYRECAKQIRACDYVIYNMGDHLANHMDIFEILRRVPGIVILHDYILQNFFRGYYLVKKDSMSKYLSKLEELYGEAGAKWGKNYNRLNSASDIPPDSLSFPFFEPCLDNAVGVVGHSRFSTEAFRRTAFCPILHIPLPHYDYSRLGPPKSNGSPARLKTEKNKIVIASFGVINPNKRLHKVLECLGRIKKQLGDKIQYLIIGPHDHNPAYMYKLESIVKHYGLEHMVQFKGYVSNAELHESLSQAEICVNLRYPAGEGGSASLAEAIYFGSAVIVSNTGCYIDIPDDCVVKIDPGKEEDQLPHALIGLVENRDWREKIRANAQRYLQDNLSPRKYAERILDFLPEVDLAAPSIATVRRVSEELRKMGVSPGHPAIQEISAQLSRFLLP